MADIKILTESELRTLVPLDNNVVDCIARAFSELAGGYVTMPPIMTLLVPEYSGEVCVKTAYVPNFDSFAIKMSPGFFKNPQLGLPSTSGMMVLFASATGMLEALLLDNGYLTDVRTAAAGGVAAQYLARRDVSHVCVVGAGVQARMQLKALTLVREIKSAVIWARDARKADITASELSKELGINITVNMDLAQAVGSAEIIVTTTPSDKPLINSDWLRAGQLVIAIGSDQEHKVELFPDCIRKATKYIPDNLAQCIVKGELRSAIEAGLVESSSNFFELGDITAGKAIGRETDDDLIIVDLTGTGVQDTAIANLAFQRAKNMGVGSIFAN